VVCETIALKLAQKHGGPKRIRVLYSRRHAEVPSESSFKRVLDKAGLSTHRRMHFDVRSELEAGRIGRDQAAFDLWRHEFNHVRPHKSLDMRTPAEVHQDCPGS
jgi:transposase InsO family protein